jgi:hypothetical protein
MLSSGKPTSSAVGCLPVRTSDQEAVYPEILNLEIAAAPRAEFETIAPLVPETEFIQQCWRERADVLEVRA